MRSDQAKTIAINDYLEIIEGISPARSRMSGRELWYHSPLRQKDNTPSFKVNTALNVWYDHGLSSGGNIIDLVCKIRKVTVRDALGILENSGLYNGFSHFQTNRRGKNQTEEQPKLQKIVSAGEKEKNTTSMVLLDCQNLNNSSLLEYLKSRKIDIAIAQKYLKQIRFKPQNKLTEYYALGFPVGQGYEARNKYFKGFVGTGKTVSLFNPKEKAPLIIFEGFMDFLSYLTYLKQEKNITELKSSVAVLNSVAFRKRLTELIKKYQFSTVYCFLDNDESGKDTQQYFELALKGIPVIDKSELYKNYKDFNEMLCEYKKR